MRRAIKKRTENLTDEGYLELRKMIYVCKTGLDIFLDIHVQNDLARDKFKQDYEVYSKKLQEYNDKVRQVQEKCRDATTRARYSSCGGKCSDLSSGYGPLKEIDGAQCCDTFAGICIKKKQKCEFSHLTTARSNCMQQWINFYPPTKPNINDYLQHLPEVICQLCMSDLTVTDGGSIDGIITQTNTCIVNAEAKLGDPEDEIETTIWEEYSIQIIIMTIVLIVLLSIKIV